MWTAASNGPGGPPWAARGSGDGFFHAALLYRSTAEYLTEVCGFVRAALGRGDPVLVAVPASRAPMLRQALGAQAAVVEFADMTTAGRNPGRLISAVGEFAQRHRGGRVSVADEPAWPGRSAAEQVEVATHEALSNRRLMARR